MTTERVWPLSPAAAEGSQVKLEVHYRNLTKIHFRAVRYDYIELLKSGMNRPEFLDLNQRNALLAKKPDLEWSAMLPATADYQERAEELPAPEGLKPGFYFLLSSGDPGFGLQNNQVSFTDVWVSSLALVMRSRWGDGLIEGFVLDAVSGEPLAGADVQAWCRVNWNSLRRRCEGQDRRQRPFLAPRRQQPRLPGPRGVQGPAARRRPTTITITAATASRSPTSGRSSSPTARSTARGRRSSTRGSASAWTRRPTTTRCCGGETVAVVFADVNGKEIARQTHRTNDYGSFSGSFTAPRDRLMGRMTIRAEGELQGMTNVSVEEYKRPKFQVVAGAAQDGPAAGRPGEPPGQGHGLHGGGRSTGPRSATAWSARCVIRAGGCGATGGGARRPPARRSPTARRSPRPTARSRWSLSPGRTCRWRKKTSRRSTTRSMPT